MPFSTEALWGNIYSNGQLVECTSTAILVYLKYYGKEIPALPHRFRLFLVFAMDVIGRRDDAIVPAVIRRVECLIDDCL